MFLTPTKSHMTHKKKKRRTTQSICNEVLVNHEEENANATVGESVKTKKKKKKLYTDKIVFRKSPHEQNDVKIEEVNQVLPNASFFDIVEESDKHKNNEKKKKKKKKEKKEKKKRKTSSLEPNHEYDFPEKKKKKAKQETICEEIESRTIKQEIVKECEDNNLTFNKDRKMKAPENRAAGEGISSDGLLFPLTTEKLNFGDVEANVEDEENAENVSAEEYCEKISPCESDETNLDDSTIDPTTSDIPALASPTMVTNDKLLGSFSDSDSGDSDFECLETDSPVTVKSTKQIINTNKTSSFLDAFSMHSIVDHVRKPKKTYRRRSFKAEKLSISNQLATPIGKSANTEHSSVSRFSDAYVEGACYFNNVLQKHPLLLNFSVTKKQLDEAGITISYGNWSKQELSILENNIEEYKARNDVNDFAKHYLQNKNVDLYNVLGENINRPIRNIKSKLEKMFHCVDESETTTSNYTAEDIKHLIALYKVHGNNWKLISEKLGRSESSVRFKFSKLKGLIDNTDALSPASSRQNFTPEEDEKIKSAVKRIAGTSDGKIDSSKICWILVSQHVGTRSSNAVRQRWFRKLCDDYDNTTIFDSQESLKEIYKLRGKIKLKEISKRNKMKRDVMKSILEILVKSNVTDANDINWQAVAKKIEGNIDPRVLKQKFSNFIGKHVPESKRKNYNDILTYLVKKEKI